MSRTTSTDYFCCMLGASIGNNPAGGSSESPVKRGRGRPKGSKNKKGGSSTNADASSSTVTKKRGRPPKVFVILLSIATFRDSTRFLYLLAFHRSPRAMTSRRVNLYRSGSEEDPQSPSLSLQKVQRTNLLRKESAEDPPKSLLRSLVRRVRGGSFLAILCI